MPEKGTKRLLPLGTDVLILRIAEAEYAGFYKIRDRFNNGETRLIDFSQIIGKGIGLCITLNHFLSIYMRLGILCNILLPINGDFFPVPLYKRVILSISHRICSC